MDIGRLLKWVVALVVVVVVVKYVVPKVRGQKFGATKSEAVSADSSCARSAERASEAWGSGLRQFIDPPYDVNAWSSFRGDVDGKIAAAESECSCAAESCSKARNAMRDLRSLVSDLDTAIRNGSAPPGDIVQRQESIDNQITEAGELTRAGK